MTIMDIEIYNPDTSNGEHQLLANYLKDVHLSLRKTASVLGAERAWQQHCQNKEALTKYAKYMEKLATQYWSENNEGSVRISWAANFCINYFINKLYLSYHEKEKSIAIKIYKTIDTEEKFSDTINVLDVGSCYNPFQIYKTFLNVMAIDLCPANDSVLQCDILEVPIGDQTVIATNKVMQLHQESFEAVVFNFLLEYIPTSELRISACRKAYSLLKPGGLLIICTPDSKHVGANAKLMKCWRYTLAQLGFSRIQYDKYKFIHCMAYRKALDKEVASRWAVLHKEPYMEFAINIRQDFNVCLEQNEESTNTNKTVLNYVDFEEMPFCGHDIV